MQRSIDISVNVMGDPSKTPSLNKVIYDAEFPVGAEKQHPADVIAENLLEQVNSKDQHFQYFDKILINEKLVNALSHQNTFVMTKRGENGCV